MTMEECYQELGGNYAEVCKLLSNPSLIERFTAEFKLLPPALLFCLTLQRYYKFLNCQYIDQTIFICFITQKRPNARYIDQTSK